MILHCEVAGDNQQQFPDEAPERVNATGRSGDGGIDGIGILELNEFVSFKVLFQRKRYKLSVDPSEPAP